MSNVLMDHLANLAESLRASERVSIALADQIRDRPTETAHAELTIRTLAASLKAQAEFINVLMAAAGRQRGR